MRARGACLAVIAASASVGCAQIAGLGDSPTHVVENVPDAAQGATQDAKNSLRDASADSASGSDADAASESEPTREAGSQDASDALATSCLDLKRRNPEAGTGLYSIGTTGSTFDTYCDMEMDDGGWTAFFVQQLGAAHAIAHFEDVDPVGNPIDTCPSATSSCLRHLPGTVTPANEFATKCGNDAVKFGAPAQVIVYWQYGFNFGWMPVTMPEAVAGAPTLSFARFFYTGDPAPISVRGWVLGAETPGSTPGVFASSSTPENPGWDYCNGSDYNEAGADAETPTVWLFYR